MWYRNPHEIINQELRAAGLEATADEVQKLVWDCSMTPGAMFGKALAARG